MAMKIDKKIIKELVDYLNEFDLSEIEYGDSSTKVKVSKRYKISAEAKSSEEKIDTKNTESGFRISSPIVGTAYLAPEPGSKKFVEIGNKIKKGQTVMIVEAMKTMNHIPSTKDGIIKKILVEDGQPVEFGQVLILLN